MIGFFVFDDIPSVDNPLVLAHAGLNTGIQGLFYVRSEDCKDVSSVKKGSEFFGVLDDNSGFGACLFIKNLSVESNALLLQHNLHVEGDAAIDGSLKVDGQITGKSNVTKLTLSAADVLTLAKQVALHPNPSPAPVTLNSVTVEMNNG